MSTTKKQRKKGKKKPREEVDGEKGRNETHFLQIDLGIRGDVLTSDHL